MKPKILSMHGYYAYRPGTFDGTPRNDRLDIIDVSDRRASYIHCPRCTKICKFSGVTYNMATLFDKDDAYRGAGSCIVCNNCEDHIFIAVKTPLEALSEWLQGAIAMIRSKTGAQFRNGMIYATGSGIHSISLISLLGHVANIMHAAQDGYVSHYRNRSIANRPISFEATIAAIAKLFKEED